MKRLPLAIFFPASKESDIDNLIGYMQTLPKDKLYPIKEIQSKIGNKNLVSYFNRSAKQQSLYPDSELHKLSEVGLCKKLRADLKQNGQDCTAIGVANSEVMPNPQSNITKEKKSISFEGSKIPEVPNQASTKKKTKKKKKTLAIDDSKDRHKQNKILTKTILSESLGALVIRKRKKEQLNPSVFTTRASVDVPSPKKVSVGAVSDNLIASYVHPSEFSIVDNKLNYKGYTLISDRVRDINKKTLTRMSNRFTIKHDPEAGEKSFTFVHSDDLDRFISESNSITVPIPFYLVKKEDSNQTNEEGSTEQFPMTGKFELPWEHVRFYDGYMALSHPTPTKYGVAHTRRFNHYGIHKNYNDLRSYIESNCNRLKVKSFDGRIIEIYNLSEFAMHFPHLTDYSNKTAGDYDISFKPLKAGSAVDIQEFNNRNLKNESPYLAHLANSQAKNIKIHYLVENVVHTSSMDDHDEYGYLFTIHTTMFHHTLVYENKEDDSRASLVFKVAAHQSESAIKWIADFLSSDIDNKREKIARGEVSFRRSPILAVKRLSHTDLHRWRYQLNSLHRLGFN